MFRHIGYRLNSTETPPDDRFRWHVHILRQAFCEWVAKTACFDSRIGTGTNHNVENRLAHSNAIETSNEMSTESDVEMRYLMIPASTPAGIASPPCA
jgi:hypothetical protein